MAVPNISTVNRQQDYDGNHGMGGLFLSGKYNPTQMERGVALGAGGMGAVSGLGALGVGPAAEGAGGGATAAASSVNPAALGNGAAASSAGLWANPAIWSAAAVMGSTLLQGILQDKMNEESQRFNMMQASKSRNDELRNKALSMPTEQANQTNSALNALVSAWGGTRR